jgi:hypothetical protein
LLRILEDLLFYCLREGYYFVANGGLVGITELHSVEHTFFALMAATCFLAGEAKLGGGGLSPTSLELLKLAPTLLYSTQRYLLWEWWSF